LAAGKAEILAGRIGDNELAAIDVVSAMVDAQVQYCSQLHDGVKQYAQKLISDPGKQNGLYWKSAKGQPKSPLGPLAAFATTEGFIAQQGVADNGNVVAEVLENHQTRRILTLPNPVKTSNISIQILAHGEAPPAIFEVRCY
jgi:Protein of unknown function (DUF2950)